MKNAKLITLVTTLGLLGAVAAFAGEEATSPAQVPASQPVVTAVTAPQADHQAVRVDRKKLKADREKLRGDIVQFGKDSSQVREDRVQLKQDRVALKSAKHQLKEDKNSGTTAPTQSN